ncbi:hypothetical protein K6Y31_02930 [Motilimonas cestriensis]|uniref:DUF4064 domain-containing protein n=1 Tax=Motilimonas cestriensis TaxID=2742685 RepID=A0ABS8W7N8_9GAMM|nr:hypothetical protein [Motilimonas cestriensis]MCE2593766.1 hypothetical protein [Motilimonas cestriensis]
MKIRPLSITIISWFFIITGLISVVSGSLLYDNPESVKLMELSVLPLAVQYAMMVIGLIITIAAGVLMLKAKRIGRTAYVGWSVISLLTGLITSPAKTMLVPSIIIFVIVAFFLFRPKANEYFSGAKEDLSSNA